MPRPNLKSQNPKEDNPEYTSPCSDGKMDAFAFDSSSQHAISTSYHGHFFI